MTQGSTRVALVTGAGQGIGKGIAKHLVASGMLVVVADIDREAVKETVAELGTNAIAAQADVSDESSVMALFETVRSRCGQLNALVNNAGITNFARTPIEQLELGEWNRIIATNLTGAFLCSKYAIDLLRQHRGSIVNIASTRALQSEPNTEAYSASKGGLVALTHALAASLGPAIRVNCISPGWIDVDSWKKSSIRNPSPLSAQDHEQHLVGRVGRPADIAALVSYLISAEADFVTGQNFVVDGGMTRKMIYAE